MRVEWVHPSWRDLVIESLVDDGRLRRRFLQRCGVDGAALALSYGGGAAGERERPLLREDADWDALGDGLHHLCGDLDELEAIRLLGVLDAAGDDDEVLALARLAMARLGWAGKAVGVDALAAWIPLAAKLDPRPGEPAIAMTWLELEPHRAPGDPRELERFADWIRLAELLHTHDRDLLSGLGFPDRHRHVLAEFADQTPVDEPVLERELRLETLARVAVLDEDVTVDALNTAVILREDPPTAGDLPLLPDEPPAPMSRFPVERVLRDLTP